MWRKNKRKKRKLEFGSNADAGSCCCAMGKVKGMDRLTANRKVLVRSQEMKWFYATRKEGWTEGRMEEKKKEKVPNGCASKGFSMRVGGLQRIEQIGKIEWLDESWIWNSKFYYWQHGSTLKNGYENDIFCLNRSTNNACSVLDLLTWRWALPPPPSFSYLSFKKQHLFFATKLDGGPCQEEEKKARF